MARCSRRSLLRCAAMLGGIAAAGRGAAAEEKLAWDFSFPAIEGGVVDLAALRGRVLLVVNTASFCGFTYQYEALVKLYAERRGRGLTVVGVPSRDFDQEHETDAAVKKFCETTFGVDFPLTAIQKVRGDEAHPFYRWVRATRNWEPSWNFGKILIGRDGRIAGAFGSSDEPMGFRVSHAIEAALSATA